MKTEQNKKGGCENGSISGPSQQPQKPSLKITKGDTFAWALRGHIDLV
jgi:hypothetical protein